MHNSVMELRNICNHPYLSQLHVEEVFFSLSIRSLSFELVTSVNVDNFWGDLKMW